MLSLQKYTVPCTADPHLLIVDMCAGDGKETEFSDVTSPAIIAKHMNFRGLNSRVIFIEKQENTFNELKKNIEYKPGMEFYLMDSDFFN